MAELTELEQNVLSVFRVTGFFSKTPKKDVSRRYDGVWRGLQINDAEISFDDIALGIKGLANKGLLRLDEDKGIASLTEDGYAVICG